MKKLKFPNADRLLGLSAILLSLCTLIVFFYQTNLIRKQQFMSVYPYLEIGHNGIYSTEYTFTIENKGVGPAIIETFIVGKNGKLIEQDFAEYLRKEIDKAEKLEIEYSNLYRGKLISEKEIVELFKVKDSLKLMGQKLYKILNNDDLQYEIVYSSIYGEKWKLTHKSAIPLKLNK